MTNADNPGVRRAPRWRRGRPHHPKDGRSRRARVLTLIPRMIQSTGQRP